MEPIIDKDIMLREFQAEDIEHKIEWINNPENNAFLHYDIPINFEKTLNWFENKNNTSRIDCVIEYNRIPVELIGLLNIDKVNQKAEFYISMGRTEYKHKGIATKACMMLIDYAFSKLKLHKLYLNTDGENDIAHRLFEKVGFSKEGEFKEDMWHRGRYIDRIRYGLLNKQNKLGEEK